MGHPPWGSSMGFTLSTSEMGSIGPCPLDRPSTARRGGGPERSPVRAEAASRLSSHRVGFCWGRRDFAARRAHARLFVYVCLVFLDSFYRCSGTFAERQTGDARTGFRCLRTITLDRLTVPPNRSRRDDQARTAAPKGAD